jgi:hypothetical protein
VPPAASAGAAELGAKGEPRSRERTDAVFQCLPNVSVRANERHVAAACLLGWLFPAERPAFAKPGFRLAYIAPLHHTRSTVPQAVALNAADCSTALSSHSSRELVGHAKLLLGRGVFEGWRGVSCQVLCGSLAGEGTWRSAAYSRTATTEFPLWCEIERDTATQVGVRAASELAPARCGSPQRRKHLRSSRA